jgi:hypothetical protein
MSLFPMPRLKDVIENWDRGIVARRGQFDGFAHAVFKKERRVESPLTGNHRHHRAL